MLTYNIVKDDSPYERETDEFSLLLHFIRPANFNS